MIDLIYISLTLVLLALSWGLIVIFEKLLEEDKS